jgi:hypothetical protein
MNARDRTLALLRALLAFGILSTAAHFTHNFVEVDQYPRSDLIGDAAIQAAIVVSWPLFTAIAIAGYSLYARGRLAAAHACLASYGLFCITTLGHFLEGSPDIPPFWFATIFTDALAGVAVLAFTARSARVAGIRAPAR